VLFKKRKIEGRRDKWEKRRAAAATGIVVIREKPVVG
jgi:hypothetical protein